MFLFKFTPVDIDSFNDRVKQSLNALTKMNATMCIIRVITKLIFLIYENLPQKFMANSN